MVLSNMGREKLHVKCILYYPESTDHPKSCHVELFGLTSKPYTWVVALYKVEIYSGFRVI